MPLSGNAASSVAHSTSFARQRFSQLESGNGNNAQAWTRSAFRLAVLSIVIFYGLALAAWRASGTVVPW
ncbi:MAG: hypothetical protein ACREDV_03580, partial [Methylocella sp.]